MGAVGGDPSHYRAVLNGPVVKFSPPVPLAGCLQLARMGPSHFAWAWQSDSFVRCLLGRQPCLRSTQGRGTRLSRS